MHAMCCRDTPCTAVAMQVQACMELHWLTWCGSASLCRSSKHIRSTFGGSCAAASTTTFCPHRLMLDRAVSPDRLLQMRSVAPLHSRSKECSCRSAVPQDVTHRSVPPPPPTPRVCGCPAAASAAMHSASCHMHGTTLSALGVHMSDQGLHVLPVPLQPGSQRLQLVHSCKLARHSGEHLW